MEDAHTTLLEVEGAEGTAFFAVYDGHGGTVAYSSSTHTIQHTGQGNEIIDIIRTLRTMVPMTFQQA